MKQILTDFNNLLKKNGSVAVVKIEDRTEWIITAKENEEDFENALKLAVENCYDSEIQILGADQYDYGYSLEVMVKITDPDIENETKIYIYNAFVF